MNRRFVVSGAVSLFVLAAGAGLTACADLYVDPYCDRHPESDACTDPGPEDDSGEDGAETAVTPDGAREETPATEGGPDAAGDQGKDVGGETGPDPVGDADAASEAAPDSTVVVPLPDAKDPLPDVKLPLPDALPDVKPDALPDALPDAKPDVIVAEAAPDAVVPVDTGTPDTAKPCDNSKSPLEDVCVVRNDLGVFVSPTGSDGSAGTKEAPMKTFASAMIVAKSAGKRIYACASTFTEAVTLVDGVDVFGGIDCAGKTWTVKGQTVLQPTTSPVITVKGATVGMRVENVDALAPNATVPGGSSIAALVVNSKIVNFRNCALRAGNGAKGADGVSGVDGAQGAAGASPPPFARRRTRLRIQGWGVGKFRTYFGGAAETEGPLGVLFGTARPSK